MDLPFISCGDLLDEQGDVIGLFPIEPGNPKIFSLPMVMLAAVEKMSMSTTSQGGAHPNPKLLWGAPFEPRPPPTATEEL